MALVLADAALEKFGGDSVDETRRNVRGLPEEPDHPVTRPRRSSCSSGRPAPARPPSAGLLAARLGVAFRDTDADVERAAGKRDRRDLRRRRRGALPGARARGGRRRARRARRGAVASAAARCSPRRPAALLRGHAVVLLEVGLSAAAQRVGLNRDRPVLALNPRAQLRDAARRSGCRCTAEVATRTVVTDGRTPGRGRRRGARRTALGRRPGVSGAARDAVARAVQPTRLPATVPVRRRRGQRAARRAGAGLLAGADRVAVVHPAALRGHRRGRPRGPRRAGLRGARGRGAGRRGRARTCRSRPTSGTSSARSALTRVGRRRRGRRRGDHRPRRLRRPPPGCAGSAWCTCRPRCSAWSTRRSAARPAINTAAGKNLVGAFHPPAGVLCDLDRARDGAAARLRRRAGRGRSRCGFTARPADPRAGRGRPAGRDVAGRARTPASWSSGRSRSRPRVVGDDLTEQGAPRVPQLRPHARARHREGRGLPLAARRRGVGRAGVRRRARPPGRPARRRHRRPAPRGPAERRAAHVSTPGTGPGCTP